MELWAGMTIVGVYVCMHTARAIVLSASCPENHHEDCGQVGKGATASAADQSKCLCGSDPLQGVVPATPQPTYLPFSAQPATVGLVQRLAMDK